MWKTFPYLVGWGWVQSFFGATAKQTDRQTDRQTDKRTVKKEEKTTGRFKGESTYKLR